MISQPLVPRGLDGSLRVLVLGRVSCAAASINPSDASMKPVEEWVRRRYDWPLGFYLLDDEAPGTSALEAEAQAGWLIGAGEWDALVVKDLTRICRSASGLKKFIRHCVANGVRVIGIHDSFDTVNCEDH